MSAQKTTVVLICYDFFAKILYQKYDYLKLIHIFAAVGRAMP
jgi:hypothetical protein